MVISEVLRKGWDITKKNFVFFLGILIAYFVLVFIGGWIFNKIRLIGQILFIIFSSWLAIGLIIVALKKVKDQDASFADLFSGARYLASFIGASILYYLLVFAGAIFLVFLSFILRLILKIEYLSIPSVPLIILAVILAIIWAIVWGIRYMFFPYLIVDKQMKAIEALKASSKITNGAKWDVLGLYIVLEIVNFLGLLCLLVGIFWTLPTVLLAYAGFYLKLAEKL